MTTILIVIDFGSSLLKVALIDSEGNITWLICDPHIALVDPAFEKHLSEQPLMGNDVNACWVSDFDRTYVIGKMAKDIFRVGLNLTAVKYESAIYKVLAIVGYLSESGRIQNKENLSIGCLLPYDEYCDSALFSKALTDKLLCFQYCGKDKSFGVTRLECYPEGFGLFSRGLLLPTEDDNKFESVKAKDVGIYILGHRNGTWLRVRYGQCDHSESETNDLGFSWMIDAIRKKTGIKDDLAIARCAYRYILTKDESHLNELIKVKDSLLRSKEMIRLTEAINIPSDQYWALQVTFLNRKAKDCEVFGATGGTAIAYKTQFNTLFPKCHWGQPISRYLENKPPIFAGVGPPSRFKGNPLTHRMVDVFGLLFYMCDPAIAKEALCG
jgi:hypothetical protein